MHCVINQNIFVRKHFLCFIRTRPFDMNPAHSFINEAPGVQANVQYVPNSDNFGDIWLNMLLLSSREGNGITQKQHILPYFDKTMIVWIRLTTWVDSRQVHYAAVVWEVSMDISMDFSVGIKYKFCTFYRFLLETHFSQNMSGFL